MGRIFHSSAEFIVEEYGFGKLNDLLRSPDCFKEIFNLSEQEFWERWVAFLRQNYGETGQTNESRARKDYTVHFILTGK